MLLASKKQQWKQQSYLPENGFATPLVQDAPCPPPAQLYASMAAALSGANALADGVAAATGFAARLCCLAMSLQSPLWDVGLAR